jgi:radical SAM superfamily enzyme YgiQ (UPF0313 family)
MKIRLIESPLAIPRYRQIRLPTVAAEFSPHAEVEINDENIERLDFSPVDLVGFTAQVYNAPRAIFLADKFRQQGIKTIIGGPYATAMGEKLLSHFDAVVVGEVEGLGEKIVKDATRGALAGIYKLDQPAVWGRNLPRRDLQRSDAYYWFNYPIEFSRGCPHKCSFCFGPYAYPTFRTRALDGIAAELAQWDHGMVEAVDLNFGADRAHIIEVCKMMQDLGVKGWFGEATLVSLDNAEVLKHLEASHCKMVFVGIESVDNAALAKINKGFNRVQDYGRIIARIQDHGIFVHGGFIWGLDGDSPEAVDATLSFCQEHKLYLASTNIAAYYPGTQSHADLDQAGRILAEDPREFDSNRVVVEPQGMSEPEIYAGAKRFLKKFYSLWSIFRRSFQAPNFRLSLLVDFWSFNLLYRAYFKVWARGLGRRRVPWRAPADQKASFPYVGGKMPFTYWLFNRSWRFWHSWYTVWDRHPKPSSLLLTTGLLLLLSLPSVAGFVLFQRYWDERWYLPGPDPWPAVGLFCLLLYPCTWLITRVARLQSPKIVALLLSGGATAPLVLCVMALPGDARVLIFFMAMISVLFFMKACSVVTASEERPKNFHRVAVFLLFYPTLDFEAAFVITTQKKMLTSHYVIWFIGLVKVTLGVGCLYFYGHALPYAMDSWPLQLAFGLGHLVLLYLLLCGTLELATGWWRLGGYEIPAPFGPKTFGPCGLSGLWRSWNTPFHCWLRRQVYIPAGGKDHPITATMATFLVSGILFAAMLAPVTRSFPREVLFFFAAQGAGVALEKVVTRGRTPGVAYTGVLYVAAIAILLFTSVWFLSGMVA